MQSFGAKSNTLKMESFFSLDVTFTYLFLDSYFSEQIKVAFEYSEIKYKYLYYLRWR